MNMATSALKTSIVGNCRQQLQNCGLLPNAGLGMQEQRHRWAREIEDLGDMEKEDEGKKEPFLKQFNLFLYISLIFSTLYWRFWSVIAFYYKFIYFPAIYFSAQSTWLIDLSHSLDFLFPPLHVLLIKRATISGIVGPSLYFACIFKQIPCLLISITWTSFACVFLA